MKTLIATLAAIAALVCAPTAQADENSYLYRLANSPNDYTGPQSVWMRIGYGVCSSKSQGYSDSSIASYLVISTGEGIYSPQAYEIISIAVQELCPDQGPRRLV